MRRKPRKSPRQKRLGARNGFDRAIHTIRGERVILDADLAKIYGVETRVLNQAVRRNREKFPADFLFELTNDEALNVHQVRAQREGRSRSQTVILKRGRNIKFRPLAFTEHGAVMAANILKSRPAIQMSVFVVRAFVKMRSSLAGTNELSQKLAALEDELTLRLDSHESAIIDVLQRIMSLLNPPPLPELPAREMGFHTTPRASDTAK